MSGSWKWPPGWKAIRQQVFRAKGRRCVWCGAAATTVDHWPLPAALGGPHEMWNLWPSCGSCNYGRGAAFGNAMRAPRTPTGAQRKAIARKARTGGARKWARSRDW